MLLLDSVMGIPNDEECNATDWYVVCGRFSFGLRFSPHYMPMISERPERGYSNSGGQMKMNPTSFFAGAARGYPIGRGQVEVRASGSGMKRILRDDEWHRSKSNGLATH